MKKTILASCFLLAIATSVFSQKNQASSNASKVPAEVIGKWLKGAFSMAHFFTYDGKDMGTPYSSSRAIEIKKDGSAELRLYFNTYNGSCRNLAFTYLQGKVEFNGDMFTFLPASGKYRGNYIGCGSTMKDFNRPITAQELPKHKMTFYWSVQDRDGKHYLVTKFNPADNDAASDFFVATKW